MHDGVFGRARRPAVRSACSKIDRAAPLLVGALLLLSSACAGARPSPPPTGPTPDDPDAVVFRLINDSDYRVRVEALTETGSVYLGDVPAADRGAFTLPEDLVFPGRRYEFQADPVGSIRCFRSDRISASRGDVIEWRLWGSPTVRCRR